MDSAAANGRALWTRWLLYPGHTLPTAVAPVLVGTGLAMRDGVFALGPATAALIGSWLIHVGGVLLDNHELLRRHAAVIEHPELTVAVRDGSLRLGTLRLWIVACFALSLVPGAWLVAIGGPFALLLGAVGVLASAGYAGGRWPYTRWGIADPLFFLMFGVVAVVGTWFAQAAARAPSVPGLRAAWLMVPGAAFWVGLPVGALITAVLVIDDLRDRHFDRVKGWRTTAVRFGARAGRIEFVALVGAAYLAPLVFWLGSDLGPGVLMPLATLPWGLGVAVRVAAATTAEPLRPLTGRMAMLSAAYALLLGFGLAVPASK